MIEKIHFYTAGCPRSHISEKNLRKVLTRLGLEIEVESIDDPKIHEAHGVSAFPALKINGELKSEGKFITVDQCEDILSEYFEA
ncbi:MAG: thioredoxin family protein [Deltaproteobacteria bacterium]|nr:MAG: thioredoxin family protein [Deltaproteobacteria bacterium]